MRISATGESTTERWERWRASHLPSRPRRVVEQRRLAQKASVKARGRNAALGARQARQAEAEPREQVRKGRAFLEAHLPDFAVVSAEAATVAAELNYGAYLQSYVNPLYINNAALRLFRALHGGREPVWVRKWTGLWVYDQHPYLTVPRKSWWLLEDTDLTRASADLMLAMRIVGVQCEADEPPYGNPHAPYAYSVLTFELSPYDLLAHHERQAGKDMAAEAFAWEPIGKGDLSQPGLESRPADPAYANMRVRVVQLDGLAPSPLRLARSLVEAWIADGKERRLPWAEGPTQAQAKE